MKTLSSPAKLPDAVLAGSHAADSAVLFRSFSRRRLEPLHRKTDDRLAERVGKTFWIQEVDGRTPMFFNRARCRRCFISRPRTAIPSKSSSWWGAQEQESLLQSQFESGKEGYFPPEVFFEELNLTFVPVDPQAGKKRRPTNQPRGKAPSRMDQRPNHGHRR